MPAKTRSPRAPKQLSLHDRVKAHMEAEVDREAHRKEAERKCVYWAEKTRDRLAAGQTEAAVNAYKKAARWKAKMLKYGPE